MDPAFVIASGDGEIGARTSLCVRSIKHFYPDRSIYVSAPPCETLPSDVKKAATKTFDIEYPIREYPISLKPATLAKAQSESNEDCYIVLDADTVLVDSFFIPEFENLAACPEHYVAGHWTKMSDNEWSQLAEKYGFSLPEKRVTAPLNGRKMIPYYNAGVVMVREDGFGEKWIKLTLQLYQDNIQHKWFSDQVALGLLSFDRQTTELPMIYNWPVDAHVPWITNSKIIHYHEPNWLLSAVDKRDILAELGAFEDTTLTYSNPKFVSYLIRMIIKHSLFLLGSSKGAYAFDFRRHVIQDVRDKITRLL